jgi:cytochrome c553
MIDKQYKLLIRMTITTTLLGAFFMCSAKEIITATEASFEQSIPQSTSLHHINSKPHVIENMETKALQIIGVFASQLKGELVSAIKQGGFESGVEVCKAKAPKIAESLSTDGWLVGRTSLRVRNIENSPDLWEAKILNQFAAQLANGASVNKLSTSVIQDDQFRMMKAIPTGSVCMACHGSSVDKVTAQKINKLYPQDNAVGYSIGDLRGAFTIQKDSGQ